MQIHQPRFHRMMIVLFGIVMGLSAYPPAMAESQKTVTLDEAIRLAFEHNPLLSASRQDRIAAEAESAAARAALLPRLELSETYMRTNNPVQAFGARLNQGNLTAADFEVDRLNHPDAFDNFRFAISLTQSIYNGGRELLGLRMARIGKEMAETDYEAARQRLRFNVTQAYYDLVLAQERLEVAQEAEQIAQEDLKQIRSRYEQGLVVKSDLLSAAVRLADMKTERMQADNAVTLARMALKNAIGLTEEVAVAEGLEAPSAILAELQSLQEEARRYRPDHRILQRELDRAETEIRIARSAFLPQLNLQGNYEVNTANSTADGSDSYTGLALLSINLFNGLGDQARLAQAKTKREKLKALLMDQARSIELEVTEAYLHLTAAQERIKVYEETVQQAEENLRIVRNRYQAGITTLIDLHTAEHLVTQSKMTRMQSLYEYRIGLTRLDRVTGRLTQSAAGEETR